mgnify:CR=1 FL=1
MVGINAGGSVYPCQFVNCYSQGMIGENGGGICGQSGQLNTIDDCYSTGLIQSNGGGIVGQTSSDNIINNCYSTGLIGGYQSGGIVGQGSSGGSVNNCYASGLLVTTATGIIAPTTSVTVPDLNNVYNRQPEPGELDISLIKHHLDLLPSSDWISMDHFPILRNITQKPWKHYDHSHDHPTLDT